MDLLMTAVIGGFVGWLASILVRANVEVGLLVDIAVGIAGAFVGIAVAAR